MFDVSLMNLILEFHVLNCLKLFSLSKMLTKTAFVVVVVVVGICGYWKLSKQQNQFNHEYHIFRVNTGKLFLNYLSSIFHAI